MLEPVKERVAQKVDAVPSKDDGKPDSKVPPKTKPKRFGESNDKSKRKEEEELSDEDQSLKNDLEMLVERLKDPDIAIRKSALECMINIIRTATSSMAAVPKPLKFLSSHYENLVYICETWTMDEDVRRLLADVLSMLAMPYGKEGKCESLYYRLKGTKESAGLWGHDYVRHLAAEIMTEYPNLVEAGKPVNDILAQALDVVPYFLQHNAEADAVDLLIEIEALEMLPEFVDYQVFPRVCLYLMSCMQYVVAPDDLVILQTAYTIYMKFNQYTSAIQVALRLQDQTKIEEVFNKCPETTLKKQLAFILARQGMRVETNDPDIQAILNNSRLSEYFMCLAKDLEIMDPKSPEDIHKSYLDSTRSDIGIGTVDSIRQNLASTFINAFANAGFKIDKYMTGPEDSGWVYKNKDCGMMSAVASIGAIMLWDVDAGLMKIDKYLYIDNENMRAGALIAIGLVSTGVRNEQDPAFALLSEYITPKQPAKLKIAAIVGLGMAYAGTGHKGVLDLLLPLVTDCSLKMEISSMAALSLGLVFVGQVHGDIISSIVQTLIVDRCETDFSDPYAIFMGLGLALLFLGKQEQVDPTVSAISVMEYSISTAIKTLLEICAYAGTGNVLKIQSMLHQCSEYVDARKQDNRFQAFSVLGIALVAMGEDIGAEMVIRSFDYLMHYGDPVVRRAIPLAMGLLSTSNPQIGLLDMLSKYSHDNDEIVGVNAIFSMGLVGAGTNNARIAQMLRQLAVYYQKHPGHMFIIRVAQGLVHLGKGTMTLNPFHSNRVLMRPVAVAGLLITITEFAAVGRLIFNNSHWLLYYLFIAAYPKLLMTLDENLEPLPTIVRVGQAVDIVGQVGRPKTITAFQTHTAPVLLAYNERAELGSDEYIPLASVLEGFVILKKNPDFSREDMDMST